MRALQPEDLLAPHVAVGTKRRRDDRDAQRSFAREEQLTRAWVATVQVLGESQSRMCPMDCAERERIVC